ncbi:MAG: 50S ribosomal protein L21 [Candidatus Marinimicrobia bacterium]|nr:50S ribosomal protein L21 [Candidatus Neomarinimicrobiota bacterium]MCF7829219.1 50S ribosomal protein L21 [Candidatus Neomarinimicrobiota bacterium]MCF7881128.1 50S ribosomal protein L21 [Candidatus Neomarinimicrobiota bacterium]
MYAVVEIKGMQYKVTPGAELNVPLTDAEEGANLTYDRVLYLQNGKSPEIGTPTVDGATVEATVLRHGKAEKVIVFKKKRRKNYRRKRGHRQPFTTIRIDDIKTTGAKSKSASKKSTKKKEKEAEPAASAEKTSEE